MAFIIAFAVVGSAEWLTNIDDAQSAAKEQHKHILLNFSGSDWCAPCIQLKKNVFEKSEFSEFANENLVLLRADFPRLKKNQLNKAQQEHNEKLAERYNPKGKFPYTVLLDSQGNIVHEWDGYAGSTAQQFVADLKQYVVK